MPTKKKVDSWGYSILGYEFEGNEVTKIWCKTCREFYSDTNNKESAHGKSFIKGQLDKYVEGTSVVKKCNFADHVKKSVAHANAVQRVGEKNRDQSSAGQKSIVTCVRGMNSQLQEQLVMKFQLAHFISLHGKPFKLYQDFVKFEREVHQVNLGQGFLTDTACHEMMQYLSRSIVSKNITKPLNDGTIRYYSVHNDGSSSAKTMDEKEIFITAHDGKVKYNVMSMEEPDEANAEGLKAALENSIMKLGLIIDRKEREVIHCFYAGGKNLSKVRSKGASGQRRCSSLFTTVSALNKLLPCGMFIYEA